MSLKNDWPVMGLAICGIASGATMLLFGCWPGFYMTCLAIAVAFFSDVMARRAEREKWLRWEDAMGRGSACSDQAKVRT